MGTHWELDGNITIKQKKFSLWVFGRGGRCLNMFDFSETLSTHLKISVFSRQGEFFNKSWSRSFNSVIKSEAVSGHAGFTRIGPMLSLKWAIMRVKRMAFGPGQAHCFWAWSCAWHLGLVMCMAFGLGHVHGLWAWSSAWPLGLVKRMAFGLGHAHGLWALLYNSLKLLKLKGFEVGEPISQEGIGTTY